MHGGGWGGWAGVVSSQVGSRWCDTLYKAMNRVLEKKIILFFATFNSLLSSTAPDALLMSDGFPAVVMQGH